MTPMTLLQGFRFVRLFARVRVGTAENSRGGRIFLISSSDRHTGQSESPSADTPHGWGDATDEQLVDAARSLQEAAWSELYRRHARQVYAYIYYRLGHQPTAEDLTADVFVRALGSIGRYSYRGAPLLAWLYRIAHHVTVDYMRDSARRARHLASQPDDVADRCNALGALDDRSDMLHAIRGLTEDQQQVVILRFYQQMSNAEVSSVMGKPEGAVKALQTRALRSLRRILVEREGAA
jgi:RNA polymerase sigma-70 factor (ECF subfamily)